MTIYSDDDARRIRRRVKRRTPASGNGEGHKKAEKITRESRDRFNNKGKKGQR